MQSPSLQVLYLCIGYSDTKGTTTSHSFHRYLALRGFLPTASRMPNIFGIPPIIRTRVFCSLGMAHLGPIWRINSYDTLAEYDGLYALNLTRSQLPIH